MGSSNSACRRCSEDWEAGTSHPTLEMVIGGGQAGQAGTGRGQLQKANGNASGRNINAVTESGDQPAKQIDPIGSDYPGVLNSLRNWV